MLLLDKVLKCNHVVRRQFTKSSIVLLLHSRCFPSRFLFFNALGQWVPFTAEINWDTIIAYAQQLTSQRR